MSDLFFQLCLEVFTHGESGASVQRPAAMDRDGGTEHALILRVMEAANIALGILLRLRLATQAIVKVHFQFYCTPQNLFNMIVFH